VANLAGQAKGKQPTLRVADLENPILRPWTAERMREANERVLCGAIPFDAKSDCWPGGVPGVSLFGAEGLYFIQTKTDVWMIWEFDHQLRQISRNRPLSADPTPSWFGESVGHYEGDTLVVDSVGMNDKTSIDNDRRPPRGGALSPDRERQHEPISP
jgi:hypothetical protein